MKLSYIWRSVGAYLTKKEVGAMRLISASRAYAAAILALAAFQSSPSSASITVPRGTDVVLAFDQELSSKHAKVGEQVKFHVIDSVIVGGKTVIKAGTPATGVI